MLTCTSATRGPSPTEPVDGLFIGFWLSHVPRGTTRRSSCLSRDAGSSPTGAWPSIDSLPDPASSAADHPEPANDLSLRRLADGREFIPIVKVFYTPEELMVALADAGFTDLAVTTTGRFFLLGSAGAPAG